MSLFQNRNFILHWASISIAQLGSFFAAIALPWLVLAVTNNNPLQMSLIVALGNLPTAFLILFGGALCDRISPMRLLFVTRSVFVCAMAGLAFLVYFGITPFWLLALFALLLGTLGAFGMPAGEALLPSILPGHLLGQGNGVIIGSTQLAQIFGPMLAGWVLWLARSWHGVAPGAIDYASLGYAFGLNAFATLLTLGLLALMRPTRASSAPTRHGLLELVAQGVRFCWQDRGIRTVLAYLALISFFLQGPLMVILPLLAKAKLGLSEAQFGTLFGMMGLGTVIGAGIAVLSKPAPRVLGQWVLSCDGVSGLCLFGLAHSQTMFSSGAFLLVIGSMGGFIMIAGITWFQQRTPEPFMGRVMSILMFAIMGMAPLSATLTGYWLQMSSINTVLGIAGMVIVLCAGTGLCIPAIRKMGQISPIGQPPGA